jgi:hypothetical protein
MAVVGLAIGGLLVAYPAAANYFIKPYFWVLIAVGLFDLAAYTRGQGAAGTMVPIEARLLGFVIGIVVMICVPMLAGTSVSFF